MRWPKQDPPAHQPWCTASLSRPEWRLQPVAGVVPADVEAGLQIGGRGIEGGKVWAMVCSGRRARPFARRMTAVSGATGSWREPAKAMIPAMDRTERFYKIELLIRNRGRIDFETLRAELEVSRATLKRDLQYLRERLDAPIVYDRLDNAYRFGGDSRARAHERPAQVQRPGDPRPADDAPADPGPGGRRRLLGRHRSRCWTSWHGMLGADDTAACELMRRVNIVAAAPGRWTPASSNASAARCWSAAASSCCTTRARGSAGARSRRSG